MAQIMPLIFSIFVFSFLASLLLTGCFRRYAEAHHLLDKPNPRGSHDKTTPRGGGLSFVIVWSGIMAGGFAGGFFPLELIKVVLPGSLLVALTGFVDDHRHLSWKIRLTVQLVAALLLVIILKDAVSLDTGLWDIKWRPYGSILAVVGIIWSVNLFNFMDGTDATASAEAIGVFAAGGIFFWLAGGKTEAFSLWFLAAGVAGFLVWNLPPAKIFMGDAGSYFLGFLVAAHALLGAVKYGIPILLWAMIYGIFWFDATVTLLRRFFRGEKWHQPHRSHAYQRLYQSGWSHGKVSLGVTALNIILSALALTGYFFPPLIPHAFITAVVVLTITYAGVERLSPMKPAREPLAHLEAPQK